jgi:hypothetical protein
MKTVFIIIITFFAFTAKALVVLDSGSVSVPDSVAQAFTQNFPNAQSIIWEQEGGNLYEVEFILNNVNMVAVFTSNGTLKESETLAAEDDN